MAAFAQGRAQALAAQFQQAELADGAELHASAVGAQGVAQARFHFTAVLALLHVDEVDDDEAAQVAQTALAGDFIGRFQVGARGGFFDVGAARGAGRVHVHRHQGFGVVDHDGAARRQVHGAAEGRFDLVLNLEAAEQRRVVAVTLDAVRRVRHHVGHELLGLFVDVVRVDQDFTHIRMEIVADGADHEAALLIDQVSAFAALGGIVNRRPELEQVVQVPLQFRRSAANAGGARDQAHALGVVQALEVLFELFAVFTLDAAADATTPWVVGHQNHIAAGQRNEGGERCALVAALFLFHLHQQRLAFADDVIDARGARVGAFFEEAAGNFLEGQEAVAFFAVIHKAGFEAGLDAGHNGLVDVAFALFAAFDFGFKVDQFLAIDNGQATLFGLRRIDEHAFHRFIHSSSVSAKACASADRCRAVEGTGRERNRPGRRSNQSFGRRRRVALARALHPAGSRAAGAPPGPAQRQRPAQHCSKLAVWSGRRLKTEAGWGSGMRVGWRVGREALLAGQRRRKPCWGCRAAGNKGLAA